MREDGRTKNDEDVHANKNMNQAFCYEANLAAREIFCKIYPQASTIVCKLLANKVHTKPSNHLQLKTFNTPINKWKLKPLPINENFQQPKVKLAAISYPFGRESIHENDSTHSPSFKHDIQKTWLGITEMEQKHTDFEENKNFCSFSVSYSSDRI